MTSEEFKRIAVLQTMRVHLLGLRPKLVQLGITDFLHLEHAERLVTELLAEPDHDEFHSMALSLYWNITFLFAEYEKFLCDHDLDGDVDIKNQFGEPRF